jgi:hypothetical protein
MSTCTGLSRATIEFDLGFLRLQDVAARLLLVVETKNTLRIVGMNIGV